LQQVQLSSLLGSSLTSSEIVELLEQFNAKAVCQFGWPDADRKDGYLASASTGGFQLRFNQHQVLTEVFVWVTPPLDSGFSAINPSIAGFPLHQSFQTTREAFAHTGVPFKVNQDLTQWLKGRFNGFSVHYHYAASGQLVYAMATTREQYGGYHGVAPYWE